MLILLSPAKTLDVTPRPAIRGTTAPRFLAEAECLVARLRRLSTARLGKTLGISGRLAAENYERYQLWQPAPTPTEAPPALLLFRGDVYEGLNAHSLTAAERKIAQQRLRILSGLYGLLRPLDRVCPYRLEMGTVFPTGTPRTLYEFWGERLTEHLLAEFRGSGPVLNLASQEYFRAVRNLTSARPVITPQFKERTAHGLRMVSFFAKRARGLMARHVLQHRVEDPEQLHTFQAEGYCHDRELSTETAPVFVRAAKPE